MVSVETNNDPAAPRSERRKDKTMAIFPRLYLPQTIHGTKYYDTILADFHAADALYEEYNGLWTSWVKFWSRKVDADDGNDIIQRDRPGDYKDGVHPDHYSSTEGHVGIYGGAGIDTVDYSLFEGGMEIDLRPVGEDVASTYSNFVNGYFDVATAGYAKAIGLNGQTIFGRDFLHSIENVIATNWDNKITGTDQTNDIKGLAGKDKIDGKGGDDHLDGGDDADTINGGDGKDVILGGAGNDKIYGEDGDDVINGGTGNDTIDGGEGADAIGGHDGNDQIRGRAGDDILIGGKGNDQIWGGDDRDILNGEDGNDKLYGEGGNDTISGGAGNDTISGGGGADSVNGQDGNDHIYVSGHDALVDGGAGFDTVTQTNTSMSVHVSLGIGGNGFMENRAVPGLDYTVLKGIEAVKTADGNDLIELGGNANKAWGQGGNDTLFLGGGDDYGWGGDGDDTLDGHTGNDVLDGGNGNDSMLGGSGNDHLLGKGGNDSLLGEAGNDQIWGGSGNDQIRGGSGDDALNGGSGADKFIWKSGDYGLDTLEDFELGKDVIDVDDFLAAAPTGYNPSYFGKVAALPTAWEGTTALYALTDNGWSAFARVEGYNASTLQDAIESGVLFGKEAYDGPGNFDFDPDNHTHSTGIDSGADLLLG